MDFNARRCVTACRAAQSLVICCNVVDSPIGDAMVHMCSKEGLVNTGLFTVR